MKTLLSTLCSALLLTTLVNISRPATVRAQNPSVKDDIEQLAVDLKVGMDRSSLTPQQKEQLRDDVKALRTARENHEGFAMMRAARSIRYEVDAGFRPEDKARIKQDMSALREARAGEHDFNM